MAQLGSRWKDFRENWHMNPPPPPKKKVHKLQISLKSSDNIGHFTRKAGYVTFMREPKLVFIDRAQQKPRVPGLAVVHDRGVRTALSLNEGALL
jgi:hypothetical protein